MGGIGTIAALHLKWVNVEQVKLIAVAVMNSVQNKLQDAAGAADLDEDGELTIEDSRVAYSKVAPLIRKHAALSTGVVGGFAIVYGSMR